MDGKRRAHGPRLGIVERDQADGRGDERGQALRDHAVELLGLRDQRPVAADLVQEREVAGVGLRLLAGPHHLVVRALEAQEGPDLEDERRRVHGLAEEVVRPDLVALPDRRGVAEGREHDDGQGGPVHLADARAGLEAGDAGEADVQDDQVAGRAGRGGRRASWIRAARRRISRDIGASRQRTAGLARLGGTPSGVHDIRSGMTLRDPSDERSGCRFSDPSSAAIATAGYDRGSSRF